jgi:hypothetical protein
MRRVLPVVSVLFLVLGASRVDAQEPAAAPSAVPVPAGADTAPVPAGATSPPSAADAPASAANPTETADVPAAAANESAAANSREHELSALLTRLTLDDELLWLEAAGERFFAFRRTPPRGKPRGTILIVPAPGRFIDETALIRSLRSLPLAGGYSTLAVQPPLTDAATPSPTAEPTPDASTVPDASAGATRSGPLCARLTAAMTAIAAEGAPLVAVAAEGGSVQAVLDCNAGAQPAGVQAFAAIGRWQGSFDRLGVPSIEFVPMRDPSAVAAAERRAAKPVAEDAPPRRRVDLDGVDGHFDGADVEVAKRLRGWLERLPPPVRSAAAR